MSPPLRLPFWRPQRLPSIVQSEAAECGLACLCMIACYWRHQTDLASLRRRFAVSLKGVTLKRLVEMAQALHLQPRPLRLELEDLPQLRLPCILHWDLNHFVVLKAVAGGHATIHDPATGERRLSLKALGKHFSGVALELAPAASFVPVVERQRLSLGVLMGQMVGLRRRLGQILLLGLALQVCALIAPFYLQWVIDEALLAADRDLVTVLGVGFLLLVLLQAAIAAVRSWLTTTLAANLNFQWLGNALTHLMRLPLPYFEKRQTGDIMSRFSSIQTIQHLLTSQFVEAVIDGVLTAGTLIMMLLYSPLLAGVACAAIALYALIRWLVFAPIRAAQGE